MKSVIQQTSLMALEAKSEPVPEMATGDVGGAQKVTKQCVT